MMRALAGLLLLTIFASLGAAQERDASRRPDAFESEYGMIVRRNVFVRDRRAAQARAQAPEPTAADAAPPPPPPPIQTQYVLVGVVFEEDEVRAYFEHLATATLMRVAPGEEIAGGRITEVQMDAVEYLGEEGSLWIEIGHDLTGRAVSPRLGPTATGTTPGTTAPGAAPAADEAGLTPEERMRRRRLLEVAP